MLLLLVALGGFSFTMIRGAVETIPPAVVTVGRLWVGAAFLYVIMRHAGRRFPPLIDSTSGSQTLNVEWRWMILLGVIGYVTPFFIFPWAQQFVESGLAGIYMAFMPIWTVVLAYFLVGESLGPRKMIGFLLGLVGVLMLMGPEVVGLAQNAALIPQAAMLFATLCYAIFAVLTRKAPLIKPRVFTAGTLLCAAIFSTPILLATDLNVSAWSLTGVLNVIGLGLGPTGLAGIIIVILIQRVNAGFMALANYLTPIWAVAMGALIFHERLAASSFIALAVILAGVAISQRQGSQRPTAPTTVKPDNQTTI